MPVAFVGRTSTLALQDPRASLRRQLRSAREWLPPDWFLAAVYWDIESGGIDLEARSQGEACKHFTDSGLPRDGGMADLLTEACSPTPRFAAVVCEDIERSGRDMFNALKLEKELSRQGIPLFATDEPADIEGVNATTVLVRRVKQGVAEWFRLQLKEKIWKGLIEHSLDGWNIGTPPYGYTAERTPHPVPCKAAQGRTKARLILDPVRAPVIAQIFTWRTIDKLGIPAIAARLNADPARYPAPSPATGWTQQNLAAMLRNPKYTGYMVYGRHRTRNGHRIPIPPDQWLWSPAPVHPAIIDRAIWGLAQTIAAGHGSSRDGDDLNSHPATVRFYPYRGRVRCRDCQRRMAGNTYGKPTSLSSYYRCPHNWASPKHAADYPDHPRSVQAPELLLDQIVGRFFTDRIFGPGRAALLAAQLPATDAAAAADRDAQEAALQAPHRPDRGRAELQDPGTGRPPRRPRQPGHPGLPGPHPRPVRRTPRRTRMPRTPAQDPGQDHTGRRRYQPPGPAPASRGHPARPAAPAQSAPVRRLRHLHLVEQARRPGHRPRRDHRNQPASPHRHPGPHPGRIPRHRR